MFDVVKKYILSLYLQYEMVTCIYMFEPWEKRLINGFVLLILSLFAFSSVVYLPRYMETFLQFVTPVSRAASYTPIYQTEKMSVSS